MGSSVRMHQFRTFFLSRHGWDTGRSLNALPPVLPYVRHVEIYDDYLSQPVHTPHHWLDDALPGIQPHLLVALRSLSLSDLCWQDQQSQNIIRDLCKHIQCLSISNLTRTHPSDYSALNFVSAAQTLEVFKYVDEEVLYHDAFYPHEVPANWQMPHSLHSLDLDGSFSYILAALRHCNSPPHVHTLTVNAINDAIAALNVVQYIQYCGASLHYLNLWFMTHDEHWHKVNEQAVAGQFCRHGGLSRSTSLQTLQLDAEAMDILAILQQITSTAMKKVVLWITPPTLGLLDLNQLATLFQSGPLSRASLEVIGADDNVLPLIEARAVLYEHLDFLRAKGQLQFKRAQGLSMDPSTPSLGVHSAAQESQFPDLTLPYK
ncbi:uncharacterized protein B0H18DRAFT_641446 [Fomitopsis serialis]|uniref:uncharacterized protein n=1 Tax=Fomitopsis serialis TaxID=139415 RepID=UPI002007FD51|nr:uncharacterized protein B0H18DRAFT_641446 [Neoantrodia serialis]KAH9933327.1 hypothetical protein B0H18DRAFT_641446 [Neoantrodia serialis]